jgi:hypothetical protein
MILHGNCLDKLKELPDNSVDSVVTDLDIGKAGEHLVCADLILLGHQAYLSDQGLPYDVVCDIDGRLLRLQVKTTRTIRNVPQRKNDTPAYLFHIRRCGKGGRRSYDERDFDAMALVALDTKEIAYIKLAEAKQTVVLNHAKFRALSDFGRVL